MVILCGGKGTRLREETEYKPKPMVEVGGRPILWHVMRDFAVHGFREFVICLGYRGELIREYFLHYRAMSQDFTVRLGADTETEYRAGGDELEGCSVTLVDTGQETGDRRPRCPGCSPSERRPVHRQLRRCRLEPRRCRTPPLPPRARPSRHRHRRPRELALWCSRARGRRRPQLQREASARRLDQRRLLRVRARCARALRPPGEDARTRADAGLAREAELRAFRHEGSGSRWTLIASTRFSTISGGAAPSPGCAAVIAEHACRLKYRRELARSAVLVSGATGFAGGWLVGRLLELKPTSRASSATGPGSPACKRPRPAGSRSSSAMSGIRPSSNAC